MIRSLGDAPQEVLRLQADVLVVGGGIAGLLVAVRVAQSGKKVIVLESGGERQDGETHPFNEVVHLRSVYTGAAKGRFRCLGGTSTRWGGAMIPFLDVDLANGQWPISLADLIAYLPQVERLFGLAPGPFDLPGLADEEGNSPRYIARLAKWPSFRSRNVATLLDATLRSDAGPEVWLHATASQFIFAPDGRLEGVGAEGPNLGKLIVKAPETVIAAGAIESTRLLLLADRQCDNRLFSPDGVLGRYFHDHLSVVVGRVLPKHRKALNRVAGFRFENGGMRNLRFELARESTLRSQVAPGFAHISFKTDEGGGFDALRSLLRQLQQRRLPNFASLVQLAKAAPWLARAVWWRFVEQRLLYPADAEIELHVVIEQQAIPQNRILLADRTDCFGLPLAATDWAVSPHDEAALMEWSGLFCDFWKTSTLSDIAVVEPRSSVDVASNFEDGGGIYHPGGSVRMGRDPTDGVLDRNLRAFRVPNLSVVSTAAFPTGGGANPTMMLMMAALRTADRLSGRVLT